MRKNGSTILLAMLLALGVAACDDPTTPAPESEEDQERPKSGEDDGTALIVVGDPIVV